MPVNRIKYIVAMIIGFGSASPVTALYKGPYDLGQLRAVVGAGGPSQVRVPTEAGPTPSPDSPMVLDYYAVKYVHPMDLKQLLSELYMGSKWAVDVRNRKLVYWAPQADRTSIQRVLEVVDVPPRQIQVDVQVVESSGEWRKQLEAWLADGNRGIHWTVNLSQLAIVPAADIDGFIGALRVSGQATMRSKPTITTNDNQKAVIKVGDRVPYLTTVISDRTTSVQVNQVDTGVELEVLPQIVPDGVIHLEVKAAIDNIKRYRELAGGQYPIVTHRLAQTTVDIPDGHTLVIAGLLDDQEKRSHARIPGLSDVPLVGTLFSGESEERSSTDVVILISPKIIESPKKKEALR